jgi:ribosome modulation factor
MILEQKQIDWEAGYQAGLKGRSYVCPAGIKDRLAWQSGYIEGRAARRKTQRIARRAADPHGPF